MHGGDIHLWMAFTTPHPNTIVLVHWIVKDFSFLKKFNGNACGTVDSVLRVRDATVDEAREVDPIGECRKADSCWPLMSMLFAIS